MGAARPVLSSPFHQSTVRKTWPTDRRLREGCFRLVASSVFIADSSSSVGQLAVGYVPPRSLLAESLTECPWQHMAGSRPMSSVIGSRLPSALRIRAHPNGTRSHCYNAPKAILGYRRPTRCDLFRWAVLIPDACMLYSLVFLRSCEHSTQIKSVLLHSHGSLEEVHRLDDMITQGQASSAGQKRHKSRLWCPSHQVCGAINLLCCQAVFLEQEMRLVKPISSADIALEN
ncbi:hypothetical protein O181_071427 [Austropuccinia psidii MF-1]|uniref:Uncharacterized protein n=1 Tax=Austropuccinia psidii MF-1 TaxID=1389203 RepID=A0A9Q3F557_9BASI|nr:hypothetical protein [Austropuccinia psidii MF-1]